MRRILIVSGLILLTISLSTACYLSGVRSATAALQEEDADLGEVLGRLEDISKAFVAVARKVRPAVVHVSATRTVRSRDFFRFEREYDAIGTGSGVIVSPNGIVVTNSHVVTGASKVTLRLHDGRILTARVLGSDPASDIAVLKIDADDLTSCSLGDSEALEVGEWVVAVGNPFGLEQSVTAGIVSAKGRSNLDILGYEDFIQTDAAINPGNSGGPLVNLKGEVVGINAVIISRTGGYQGIGLAIPINMVRVVVDGIVSEGRIVRSYLGVRVRDEELEPEAARSAGLTDLRAALVVDLVDGGPAEEAGIQVKDLILKIGSRRITDIRSVRAAISQQPPGSKVLIVLLRDDEKMEVTATLADRSRIEAARRDQASLGIRVMALNEAQAERYGYRVGEGVLVTSVERGSRADRAGLQRGDLIVSLSGKAVSTPEDMRKAIDSAGDRLALEVRRGDVRMRRLLYR